MATLNNWVAAFDKGDKKAAIATCADEMVILDDIPPYQWRPPGACQKWWVAAEKSGITNTKTTLGKPRHFEVTGDRAYVVIPVDITYTIKGKAKKQSGATVTATLKNGDSGWRFIGWSWADPD